MLRINRGAWTFFDEPDAQSGSDIAPLPEAPPSQRFATPPWNRQSPEWCAIDQKLDADHLARKIARLVDEELDLGPLFASYKGVGKLPYPPDLLLKLALYEHQIGRPQPTQWFKDLKENTTVQWQVFGILPARSVLYEFRDRVQPYLEDLNRQVLHTAIEEEHTTASTGALDGTFVAANASRHRLVTLETVEQRLEVLNQEIARDEAETTVGPLSHAAGGPDPAIAVAVESEAVPRRPEAIPDQQPSPGEVPRPDPAEGKAQPRSFMAKTKTGRKRQRARYEQAKRVLEQLHQTNSKRRKDKCKPSKRIRVAIGDPTAPFGRDKQKVYRPLYNVQTMTDMETDFVLGYSITPTLSDSGHLVPMIDLTTEMTGQPLRKGVTDSGYPTGDDLARCQERGVEVYAPWNENSFTAKNRAKAGEKAPIRKDEFKWDPEISGYRCPEGHPLAYRERSTRQKANGETVPFEIYQANPTDCQDCPLKARCLQRGADARTVRRQPHQDLIDAMRERTNSPEGKELYRQRGSTAERRFADAKTYRALHRFSGQGIARATAQVELTYLAHNLLTLEKARTRKAAA